jgi:outer membrane protein TolC
MKSTMNRLYYVWIILFISGTVFSQTEIVPSFTMEEAIAFGLENHEDIQIAANELERARQQMIEARAIGLPQLNAGVDYSYFIKLPTSLIPAQFLNPQAEEGEFLELSFGTKNNLTASATLSTLIFDGTYLMALQASRKYIDMAKVSYENQRIALSNDIKKAYLPPLLVRENIQTVTRNIEILEQLYFETNEMYRAGFVEKLDVDKLFLTVDNMKVLKKDLEKNYQITLDALKVQIGYPIEKPMELTETVLSLSGELDESLLIAAMDYEERPEFRLLNHSRIMSELNVKRYQRGYWPSLSGFLNYQQVIQGDDLFNDPISTPASVAGLTLTVPIFDGFMKKSRIQQAKLDVENIVLQQDMMTDVIDFQLKSARESYLNALENVKSRKRNLDLAGEIFEMTQDKYKEGVGSSLEIIQAEQSLQDSQQNYLRALYDFVLAKIDVQIALGKA